MPSTMSWYFIYDKSQFRYFRPVFDCLANVVSIGGTSKWEASKELLKMMKSFLSPRTKMTSWSVSLICPWWRSSERRWNMYSLWRFVASPVGHTDGRILPSCRQATQLVWDNPKWSETSGAHLHNGNSYVVRVTWHVKHISSSRSDFRPIASDKCMSFSFSLTLAELLR